MQKTTTIKYSLKSTDIDFTVDLVFDTKDFSLFNLNADEKDWTRLAFYKCSHCPLTSPTISPTNPGAEWVTEKRFPLDRVKKRLNAY